MHPLPLDEFPGDMARRALAEASSCMRGKQTACDHNQQNSKWFVPEEIDCDVQLPHNVETIYVRFPVRVPNAAFKCSQE